MSQPLPDWRWRMIITVSKIFIYRKVKSKQSNQLLILGYRKHNNNFETLSINVKFWSVLSKFLFQIYIQNMHILPPLFLIYTWINIFKIDLRNDNNKVKAKPNNSISTNKLFLEFSSQFKRFLLGFYCSLSSPV